MAVIDFARVSGCRLVIRWFNLFLHLSFVSGWAGPVAPQLQQDTSTKPEAKYVWIFGTALLGGVRRKVKKQVKQNNQTEAVPKHTSREGRKTQRNNDRQTETKKREGEKREERKRERERERREREEREKKEGRRKKEARSKKQEARSKKQEARSKKQEARSKKQEARSKKKAENRKERKREKKKEEVEVEEEVEEEDKVKVKVKLKVEEFEEERKNERKRESGALKPFRIMVIEILWFYWTTEPEKTLQNCCTRGHREGVFHMRHMTLCQ